MGTTVPTRLQKQFESVIWCLNEKIGEEATRAYLKSLCSDASLDTLFRKCRQSKRYLKKQRNSKPSIDKGDIRNVPTSASESANEDGITNIASGLEAGLSNETCSESSSQSLGSLKGDLPTVASPGEDIHTSISWLSASIPETDYNNCISNSIIHNFLRPNLLVFLSKYWEVLKAPGLYYPESAQCFQWELKDSPIWVHRLHYHLILDHLRIEDDLYQWRRSIAEINNLNGYNAFFAETEDRIRQRHYVRRSGETNIQMAHKDYLAYIYADRVPKDFDKAKQALKKNLEFGRRWSILVDGFVKGNTVVPGLGLGVLLLCGPYIKKKMSFPTVAFKKYKLTKI